MSNKLSVSSIIQIYTKYESIAGVKAKVIGTLAYSECENVPFNMTTLAINERVISVKDEDLETFIGNDTIYHCRETEANADGTFNEYIIWDSIINFEKTKKINQTYNYNLSLKIIDTTNVPISHVISGIEKFLASNYSQTVEAKISPMNESNDTTVPGEDSVSSNSNHDITDEQLDRAEAILSKLSSFENRLIPAAEKITNSNLSESLDSIIDKVDTINKNVSIIAQNV